MSIFLRSNIGCDHIWVINYKKIKTGTTVVSYFGSVTASLFALTIVRKFTPR